jgi:hypothetical protein
MQRNTYFEDQFVRTFFEILEMMQRENQRQRQINGITANESSERKPMETVRDEVKRQLVYDILYHHAKRTYPELFQVTEAEVHHTFPLKDGRIDLIEQTNGFTAVLHRNGYDPYRITPHFSSRSDVLIHLFQTEKFERVHGDTIFKTNDGKVFSLLENSAVFTVAPGEKIDKVTYVPSIEQARLNARRAQFETVNGDRLKTVALKNALEKHNLPSELVGKKVTIENVNPPMLKVSTDDKEYEIQLPDVDEQKWKEHIQVTFDEVVLSSASFAEGFLEFYGLELKQQFEKDKPDFEVYGDENGFFVGHLRDDGSLKQLSKGYHRREEDAKRDLQALKAYMAKESELEPRVEREAMEIIEERTIER